MKLCWSDFRQSEPRLVPTYNLNCTGQYNRIQSIIRPLSQPVSVASHGNRRMTNRCTEIALIMVRFNLAAIETDGGTSAQSSLLLQCKGERTSAITEMMAQWTRARKADKFKYLDVTSEHTTCILSCTVKRVHFSVTGISFVVLCWVLSQFFYV